LRFTEEFFNSHFSETPVSDLILEIFSSSNRNEIYTFRIIPDSRDIKYFTLNSVLSDLYPGPYIWGYNAARFYITMENHKKAQEVL